MPLWRRPGRLPSLVSGSTKRGRAFSQCIKFPPEGFRVLYPASVRNHTHRRPALGIWTPRGGKPTMWVAIAGSDGILIHCMNNCSAALVCASLDTERFLELILRTLPVCPALDRRMLMGWVVASWVSSAPAQAHVRLPPLRKQ